MANTASQVGSLLVTDIPQTAGDIPFTFNVKTWKALLQCDADTTAMFADAAASSTKGKFSLPTINKSPPLELVNIAGQTVVFNGTNATNLQIMEFLGAST